MRNFKDNPKALKQGMCKRSAFLLLRMFSLLLTSSLTQLDCFKEGKQREFLEKLFDAVRDEFQLFDADAETELRVSRPRALAFVSLTARLALSRRQLRGRP